MQWDSDEEFNPYAAPDLGAVLLAPTSVYRLESRRVSYAEYRRMSGNLVIFAILAALKTLRVPYRFEFGITRVDRLHLVDREAIPEHALREIANAVAACESAGMSFQFAFRVPTVGSNREAFGVVFLSNDRRTLGLAIYARSRINQIETHESSFTASSELADGRCIGVSNGTRGLDNPPRYDGWNRRGRPAAEVLGEHRDRLGSLGVAAVPFDPDRLVQAQLDREHETIDFQRERGVFVPMSQGELDRLNAKYSDAASEASGPSSEGPAARRLRTVSVCLWLALLVLIGLDFFSTPSTPSQWRFRMFAKLSVIGAIFSFNVLRWIIMWIGRHRAKSAGDAS